VHDLPWDELGHRDPDHVGDGVDVLDDAPHLRCGQPARLGAQPKHDLVAVDGIDVEMDGHTDTAGRGQPVQQRLGRCPQLGGLKEPMPQWATLAMSSSAQACNPTNATRSAETVAGSSCCTSGGPWSVNAATAMAWNPGYWLAGVPTSGWESIQMMARSST
jgi:hypothetical protein